MSVIILIVAALCCVAAYIENRKTRVGFGREATANRAVKNAVSSVAHRNVGNVAFSAALPSGESTPVMFPDHMRNRRINPEAILYVQYYRAFGRALCFIQLHGTLRKELGPKIHMKSVEITGMRDDDVMATAVSDAEALLRATTPTEHSAPADASEKSEAPKPEFVAEGALVFSGLSMYQGKNGPTGKMSFCIRLRKPDGTERRVFGSDLERALRESEAMPGDLIKATKFPKVPVVIGTRTVHRNVWSVEKIGQAWAA